MAPPKRFPDRDEIAAVREEAAALEPGSESPEGRRLAGRVMARRGMGKLVFLDLVDRSGRLQLMCDTGRTGEIDVHLGDVVGVVGKPAKTRRGEPSLAVDSLEILSRNRNPLPDTFHGLTDQETRYRKRYLDLLMNEDTREAFLLRTRMVSAIRRYLDEEGFVEVETPILQPRYGGAFAHPFVTHSNELDADLYLRIATELYLKRLIVGGLERVYEIGKDFRNESISYKHQPEFTMLEWYEAYADYRDTMERMEELLERVALETLGTTVVRFRGHEVDLRRPWRRLRFVEALEDLAFQTLHPRKYAELKAMVADQRADREAQVAKAAEILGDELAKADIPAEITGRAKHLYSIYDKMAKRGREFNEIYDLTAMRVICERSGEDGTRDCYAALGIAHSLWKPMPGRFKDFIAMPKLNRYRSLHTTVIGPEGKPLEIQVRTREMHEEAEYGVAAHWLYKRGRRVKADDEWLAWVKSLMDWQGDEQDPGEYMRSLRTDLFADEVYVFTPKGEVKVLPAGATPIDFAYAVHTDVGHRTVGATRSNARAAFGTRAATPRSQPGSLERTRTTVIGSSSSGDRPGRAMSSRSST